MAIGESNWSLKVSDGWPEDPREDVEAGAWAGVIPMAVRFGAPQRAPDCPGSIPVPASVVEPGRIGAPPTSLPPCARVALPFSTCTSSASP